MYFHSSVEDLSRLPSQEQLGAFPELSRDQIDTLLKVPSLAGQTQALAVTVHNNNSTVVGLCQSSQACNLQAHAFTLIDHIQLHISVAYGNSNPIVPIGLIPSSVLFSVAQRRQKLDVGLGMRLVPPPPPPPPPPHTHTHTCTYPNNYYSSNSLSNCSINVFSKIYSSV